MRRKKEEKKIEVEAEITHEAEDKFTILLLNLSEKINKKKKESS